MENKIENAREKLNKEVKGFSWAILILSFLPLITLGTSIIQYKDFTVIPLAICGFLILLVIQSFSIIKEIPKDIDKLRKKILFIFIETFLCSILYLLNLRYALFFFFLPFYSLLLLRSIYRFTHNFYSEKRFLDKLLKVLEVLMIISLTILGLILLVMREVGVF